MLLRILKISAIVSGCIFFIMLMLALTPAPFYMHRSLGTDPNKTEEIFIPEYIIMLGGGGMPSENNLMRLYYTSQYSDYYQVPVIILHPEDSVGQVKMLGELTGRGINPENILFSTGGANTHSQVISLKKHMPELSDKKLLIITSPEHLRRSVKCFNKSGFSYVHGAGAFDAEINFSLSLDNQELAGNKYIPEINNTKIRYTFWNYLKLEIVCLREYFAIFYYKLKGWI
ncbi:MAG: YdcF family protein [Bacteroidales bacterium]|nr:YdcF family protein [Bacteroidales bacterium]